MNDLRGKVAIITGATSGMGEAAAKQFAKAGAMTILVGRNVERGQGLVNLLSEAGFQSEFFAVDVADEEQVNNFARKVESKYDHIDILFNNAGVYPASPALEEIKMEQWDQIFGINLRGVVLITKALLPAIVKSRGNILNNASVAGLQSYTAGKSYAYAASKSGVIQLTQMMAKNYGDKIRVNCICPGVIDTPIFINRDFSRFNSSIPMQRVGTVEEVAKVANFLVSEDASFVNGAILTVDGGQSL